MMGKSHAATGVLAGLLVGPLVGLTEVETVAPFAATTAGYALLPDLDHPTSTVTRRFGPATRGLSAVVRAASAGLYRVTKGPRDEDCAGTHRHLTHTFAFAVALGGVCAATTAWGGAWAVGAWLVVGLILALDRLGPLVLAAYGLAAAAALPALSSGTLDVAGALAPAAGWMGLAVALGCVTHCLGDALTESGCPLLFPVPIAGETWYEVRPPRWLRFRTGRFVETRLVFPTVLLACALAVPGALDLLTTTHTAWGELN